MEIKVTTKFNKVDVRRDKEYAKVCVMKVLVPEINTSRGHSLDFFPIHFFREEVAKRPGLEDSKVENLYSCSNSWTVTLTARVDSKKPSLIVSDDKARKLLPSDETMASGVRVAYEATQYEAAQVVKKYNRWQRTMQLLNWFLGEIKAQAKKNMRFEQRLSALSAEYMAEVMTILPDELKQAKELAEKDEDGRFCELSIIYLEKYAEKYVKEHLGSGLPNMFPRHTDNNEVKWIMNQVEPKEEKDNG